MGQRDREKRLAGPSAEGGANCPRDDGALEEGLRRIGPEDVLDGERQVEGKLKKFGVRIDLRKAVIGKRAQGVAVDEMGLVDRVVDVSVP